MTLSSTSRAPLVADYFQKWRTLSQIKKQGCVKLKIRKRRNDCTCTLHPMESQVPSIGGKSLVNISESILKKTPNATLEAFCSKYDLAVVYSKKRKRFVKEDYIESILHLKRSLVTPKVDEDTDGRKREPRKRRKTEKALAAEDRSARSTQTGVGEHNQLKRAGDELFHTTTKRMRTLALKDILPTNNPAANIISLSRPLTWINTNPTHPSGTAATGPATGNTNSSSVAVSEPPRSWEWEYYSPPTDQTIEGPAKSSTGGASTAAISPAAIETVGVRIYLRATDMDHVLQAQVHRGMRREINLVEIMEQLNLKGECCLIDPSNNKPFYPYDGNIVDGDDVDDMTDSRIFCKLCVLVRGCETRG